MTKKSEPQPGNHLIVPEDDLVQISRSITNNLIQAFQDDKLVANTALTRIQERLRQYVLRSKSSQASVRDVLTDEDAASLMQYAVVCMRDVWDTAHHVKEFVRLNQPTKD